LYFKILWETTEFPYFHHKW